MGERMTLSIEFPDEVTPLLGANPEAKVLEAVLLQFVREGKMSVGYAGQILGLDRLEAIQWYTGHGYHYPALTPTEMDDDLEHGLGKG
mgnify:CR=1 FL=1